MQDSEMEGANSMASSQDGKRLPADEVGDSLPQMVDMKIAPKHPPGIYLKRRATAPVIPCASAVRALTPRLSISSEPSGAPSVKTDTPQKRRPSRMKGVVAAMSAVMKFSKSVLEAPLTDKEESIKAEDYGIRQNNINVRRFSGYDEVWKDTASILPRAAATGDTITPTPPLPVATVYTWSFMDPRVVTFRTVIQYLSLWSAWYLPFWAGFLQDWPELFAHPLWICHHWLIDALMWCNMVMNFCVTVVDRHSQTEIWDPTSIARHYIRSIQFGLDLFLLVPFELVLANGDAQFEALLRCLRVLRIHKLWHNENNTALEESHVSKIGWLLAFLLLFAHWTGCLWLSLLDMEGTNRKLQWMIQWELQDKPMLTRYLICLYEAGLKPLFGDSVGTQTDIERLFGIMLCIAGSVFHAVIFGHITLTLERMNAFRSSHQQKMWEVTEAMSHLNLPNDLRERVICYHKYIFENFKGGLYEGFISELSLPLQTEIRIFRHITLLKTVWLFKKCEHSVLREIVMSIEDETYLPGDYIVRKGDMGNDMYFILKGTVELMSPSADNVVFKVLHRGDYFGELALLQNERRMLSIRCTAFCQLGKLSKTSLFNVIQMFPELYQSMEEGMRQYYKHDLIEGELILRKIRLYLESMNIVAKQPVDGTSPKTLAGTASLSNHLEADVSTAVTDRLTAMEMKFDVRLRSLESKLDRLVEMFENSKSVSPVTVS